MIKIMTDANGAALYETIMQELNNLPFSDENKEEQEDFLCHEEAADDIPPSLLSYFEASNNRAAACKKLFLEELEDLTSYYTEDGMSLPIELEKDVMKLNEKVVGETEDKEKNTSVVSSSNKGEAETAELTESSQKEEEIKESGECQREHREEQHSEEMKKEEQRRQREKNFQEELKKIMVAEKLHRMELELMEKKAQEKLKQELLLQQELMSNLQKRVEEERRMKEEEQKRMKEEEEKKRKREEEKFREMEAEMRKIKEIRCKEEERRIKEEELRIKEEEEKRRVEKDAKKNREEEKNKIEEEMIKREEIKIKQKRATEGDERRMKENEDKIKERNQEREEETRKRREVTREKMEGNKKKIMLIEDCKEKEVEEKGREGEVRITKELKKQEEMRKNEEKRTNVQMENDVERRHSVENKGMMRKEEENKTKEGEKEAYRQMEEKVKLRQEMDEKNERRINHKERKQEEEKKKLEKDNIRKREDGAINIEPDKRQIKDVGESKEERRLKEEKECKKIIEQDTKKEQNLRTTNELQEKKRGKTTGQSLTSQLVDSITWTSSSRDLLSAESTASPISSENVQQHDIEELISQTSVYKTIDQQDGLPVCLPEHTEQKRLSWMKDCTSWSKLSLQNRRKQKICVQSRRVLRKAAEASTLPPLCQDRLLLSTGCKSLQELTTVTLEDMPGCTLSSLVQCTRLQSLTLRRCGLKSLEGLNQLSELCYIDVQENDISFVDCEDMTHLRVLQLGHNKLTSIHGLSGADGLDVLELSHNSITRITGLESMRRLQRLSVDHNQLISTIGLRDVYTLLYLNCSHNHLVNVEGIENSALLNTLDLRANSLTEPPSLNNHVLLRELHLDDNCISSLQGLAVCWLPLMQHLSSAQNRITELPCMSDFVSLANLDLQFNCISELQNLCESLKGCKFLQEVHLTGNPLQQESGWRCTLEKALPDLRAIDDQVMDSFLSPPPVQQVSLSSVTFLTFCQAQLQQTCELQQQLSRELNNASSSLDVVKDLCWHFTEILKLAEDQRFAHEYGNITVFASQMMQKKSVAVDSINAEMFIKHSEMEATDKALTVNQSRNNIGCSYWTFEDSSTENWCDPLGSVTAVPKTDHHSKATKEITSTSDFEMVAVSNYQDLDLKSTAAVMIQQWWRKYRQKCGIIRSPLSSERERGRGGDGGKPELEPSYLNGSFVGQHQAATVIQAFWRGFTLRRRLASALAAVACLSTKEDDTFEEVDMDEFVFDGTALEKQWTLQLRGDSPSRCDCESEVALSLKPLGLFRGPPQDTLPPPAVWRPKQAWVAGEHLGSAWQSDSSETSNRSKSPASASQLSGLSKRSEKILEEWGFTNSHTALLMLKRAEKMKSKKEQQQKHKDPLVRLALFRNCNYQLNPVETRNRPTPHNRKDLKVCMANLGDKTEQVKQERTQHTDRDLESEHFLPEISPDILNGGRVQLVADPGHTVRHHSGGLWANSSLAVQPCRQNLRRNSFVHASKDVLSPKRVVSAPSKKERISFRDNPVQLSGGWGGGKKRDKVHK